MSDNHLIAPELSVDDLRRRGKHARDLLRHAREAIGSAVPNAALQRVDAVLDEIEPILATLQPPVWSAVDAAVRGLTAPARWTLREAIDAERAARRRLARMIGEAPVADVDRALARVEEQAAILREFAGLLTVFERAFGPASPQGERAV
jgi:hypothetical protein